MKEVEVEFNYDGMEQKSSSSVTNDKMKGIIKKFIYKMQY